MTHELIYLFAVCDRAFALPADPPGLFLHPHSNLWALARAVRAAEFGEEAIQAQLQDMEWLARQASQHQAVLAQAMTGATMLPFKFATLFANLANLDAMLASRAEGFAQQLAHLHGKAEYGVKIYLRQGAAAQFVDPTQVPALAELTAELAQATPGKAFLLRRRQAQLVAESESAAVGQWVDAQFQVLVALASAATANPPQTRRATGREADMVLNAAFLLTDEQVGPFSTAAKDLVQAHAGKGVDIEVSGPWPAYNFS
jgi:hypothetical protein